MSSKNILDLPVEILLNIFSYLPLLDVLCHVQLVCKGWRNTVQVPELWNFLTYSPQYATTTNIVKFIKAYPLIRRFHLAFVTDIKIVLPAILQYSLDIRSLHVELMEALTLEELDNLLAFFPNLESFLVRLEHPHERETVERISKCTKLKCLTLTGQCLTQGLFRPIADRCMSLKHLSFGSGRPNVNEDDIIYILDRMKSRLVSIYFICYGTSSNKIIEKLGACSKLERISTIHEQSNEESLDIHPLQNLGSLKSLKIDFLSQKAQQSLNTILNSCWSNLIKLDLNFAYAYNKESLKEIFECYPKLEYLGLSGSHPLGVETNLENIYKLPKLAHFRFRGCETLTYNTLQYLRNCSNLCSLDLTLSKSFIDIERVFEELSKCNKLENLILEIDLSIDGQSLCLITKYFPYLKHISLTSNDDITDHYIKALETMMPKLHFVAHKKSFFGGMFDEIVCEYESFESFS